MTMPALPSELLRTMLLSSSRQITNLLQWQEVNSMRVTIVLACVTLATPPGRVALLCVVPLVSVGSNVDPS
jgi:hypothetical protein